jgi:hypothetical protein
MKNKLLYQYQFNHKYQYSMTRKLLLLLAISLVIVPAMAQDGLWTPVPKSLLQTYMKGRSAVSPLPLHYELVKLNRSLLQQLQQQAPLAKPGVRAAVSPVRISLPLPMPGKSVLGAFTESPVLSNTLAQQLPHFNTYELTDPVTHSLQGRLTITAQGVTGFIFTADGSAYISPVSADYPDVHMVYYVKDIPFTQSIACGVKELIEGTDAANRLQTTLAGDCQLRNFKLAVAATGEYTVWAGSQSQALAYIGTLVNDVTAIYERDAAITFTLVSNTSIIFTDSLADPYPTTASPNGTTLSNNHNTITSALGTGNFDEGIVVNKGWNGGLASVGVVCNNALKGQAAAGLTFGSGSNPTPGPQGPIFTGTVAHEMGHQFSAMHTFAATNGVCGSNTNAPTAYEPGGGSTIMAYAGSCTGNSYQSYTDLYFHGGSILAIDNYAVNYATCVTPVALSNTAPAVTVPATSYTIPASTPFMLTATGTDADNNTLYYSWEEMDAGVTTGSAPSATATSGPNFRSYPPTTSSTRVFPRMKDLVNNASTPYEVLPAVTRSMNFQVMVRDEAAGGGCTAQQTVTVNTNAAAGAFAVTSQTTATTWAANGSNTATITWNVAGTDAAPVNCATVDILFSTDGGVTYPDTLAANTPNDGSEAITIPSLPTSIGRIMIKARGNIFFNINAAFITITSSCVASGATFTPDATVTGAAGSSTLNLSLSPVYGSVVNITGSVEAADPGGYLAQVNNSTSACSFYSNAYLHDTYQFTPSVSGNYTFTRTAGSAYDIFNLYSESYVASNPCTSIINSSFQTNGSNSTITNTYTATLTAGLYYTMTVGSFDNTGDPQLPNAYAISVSGPGALYSYTPSPGAGFNYTYVIVDNATGLIKAIDANADLSNAAAYPTGSSYTVYGLSYPNTVAATTLNSYAGTSFAAFRHLLLYSPSTLCGSVSANSALVNITSALPVTMLPLTAHKAGSAVNLKWATASSQNSSYFELWRSANGNNFDKLIGTVPAVQAFSSSPTDYELNDNTPLATWNYYRVKEVDIDGSATLGNIARINMQQDNASLIIYPNPVRSSLSLTLEYTAIKTAPINVRVLNSTGSMVYQKGLTAQTGTNRYTLPAAGLPKGVYVVQLISDSGSSTARFVKE